MSHLRRCAIFTLLVLALGALLHAMAAGGELLFHDGFDDPGSHWTRYTDAECEYAYEDGRYTLAVAERGWLYWVWAPYEGFPVVFQASVQAYSVGWSSGGWGLLWGIDDDNFYLFRVTTNGEYAVDVMAEGVWQPSPVPLTHGAPLNQGLQAENRQLSKENEIRVEASTDLVTLWVEGTMIAQVPIPSLGPGRIGLAVQTMGDPNYTVSFDEFRVFALD